MEQESFQTPPKAPRPATSEPRSAEARRRRILAQGRDRLRFITGEPSALQDTPEKSSTTPANATSATQQKLATAEAAAEEAFIGLAAASQTLSQGFAGSAPANVTFPAETGIAGSTDSETSAKPTPGKKGNTTSLADITADPSTIKTLGGIPALPPRKVPSSHPENERDASQKVPLPQTVVGPGAPCGFVSSDGLQSRKGLGASSSTVHSPETSAASATSSAFPPSKADSAGATSAGTTAAGATSAGTTAAGATSTGATSAGATSTGATSAGATSAGAMSAGVTSVSPPSLAIASMKRLHAASQASSPFRVALSFLLGIACAAFYVLQSPNTCSSFLLPKPWTFQTDTEDASTASSASLLDVLPFSPFLFLFFIDTTLILSCALLGIGAKNFKDHRRTRAAGDAQGMGALDSQSNTGLIPRGPSFASPDGVLDEFEAIRAGLEKVANTVQKAQYTFTRANMAFTTGLSFIRDLCVFVVTCTCLLSLCPVM